MKTSIIDENGMLTLPDECIKAWGLGAGSRLCIEMQNNSLTVRPAKDICTICGSDNTIDGFAVCKKCSKIIYDRRINI